MKTVLKFLVVLLLILAFVIIITVMVVRGSKPANQPILLSDGTTIRYLGTTVGTNHVFGSKLQRVISRLPNAIGQLILKLTRQPNTSARIQTTRSNIVVWVEQTGIGTATSTSRKAMLRIPDERFGGEEEYVSFWLPAGQSNRIHSVQFQSWPRRVAEIECVIMEQNAQHKNVPVGSFRFDTPVESVDPPLQPDPIPIVKAAGDLKITLLDFATGVGNNTTHRSSPENGREKVYTIAATHDEPRSIVHVDFDSPRGTNDIWFLYNADLSDGSGNLVAASSRSGMSDHMVFSPVLWPDEPAWTVRLHMKRKAGFAPGELIEFSHIAVPTVGSTNVINETNVVNGINLVFRNLIVRPPLKDTRSYSGSDLSQFRLEHDQLDGTNQVDLVSITVQPMGTNLTTSGSGWSDDYHEYSLMTIPTNATHMDFVFSVQQARFVEFNVAPNWITNDYVIRHGGSVKPGRE